MINKIGKEDDDDEITETPTQAIKKSVKKAVIKENAKQNGIKFTMPREGLDAVKDNAIRKATMSGEKKGSSIIAAMTGLKLRPQANGLNVNASAGIDLARKTLENVSGGKLGDPTNAAILNAVGVIKPIGINKQGFIDDDDADEITV